MAYRFLIALFMCVWSTVYTQYKSVQPIWLTSNFMRAGNRNVISSLTGNTVDPIFTFTFSSALSGTPSLAYGVGKYMGDDTIRDESFQIRQLALNSTSFRVQVDIQGSTWIYILNVPYLAIDPSFPHHLNSFDNVPINYGKALSNITVKNKNSPTTYSNMIDYTQQCAGRKYNTFPTPLNTNRILLYFTSIGIYATGWDTDKKFYPFDLNVNYEILTPNTYNISATVQLNVQITRLQFSMIVFNAQDVQSSKKYVLVFEFWETDFNGGFKPIPVQFIDNFIIGLTEFSTVDGKCIINYQWSFTTVSGKYGVRLNKSTSPNPDYNCGLSRMKSTMFYMKTWKCPDSHPYFNLTTDQCQNSCGFYYFGNTSVYQCQECQFGCSQCPNAAQCSNCDSINDFRILANVSGKPSCVCMPGYFQDPINAANKICLACISNCLSCNETTSCNLCNQLDGYILTTDKKCKKCGYGCLSCNQIPYICLECIDGMVYDSSQQKCVCQAGTYASNFSVSCLPCHETCGTCTGPSATNCINCSTTSTHPFYNATIKQCQTTCGPYTYENRIQFTCPSCPVGCISCFSFSVCTSCDSDNNFRSLFAVNQTASCPCSQGYYQDPPNPLNNVCLKCNIQNCLACENSTSCTLCSNSLPGFSISLTGSCVLTCGFGCFNCNQTSLRCITCRNRFLLNGQGRCECLNGTFPSTTNVSCLGCHSKCSTCTGPAETNCASCPTSGTLAVYLNSTTTSCQKSCGLFFYENTTALQCQACNWNCRDCAQSPECTECDQHNHFRRLVSRSGRRQCICMLGYFQDPQNATNPVCIKCINNCYTCKDNTTCDICNEAAGYILSENKQCVLCGFGCGYCNPVSLECDRCRIGFQLDPISKECFCPNGTVKATKSVVCTLCHATCKTCTGPSPYECTSCDHEQNRISLRQANNLTQCICNPFAYTESTNGSIACIKKSNESCEFGFIYIREKKECIEICGDGKNFGMFQCDDGNLVDGDGCSKTCQIQQDFECKRVNGSDTCLYIGVVNITEAKAFKYPFSNHLLVQCKLDPIKRFFYSLDWKSGVILNGPKIQLVDSWMEGEWLNINTTYFEDLTGKTLTIKYSSGMGRNRTSRNSTRRLLESIFDFDITLRDYELPIAPVNNIKPTYLEQDTYETVKNLQKALFIIATCTIALVLAGFILKTVFPLWQLLFSIQLMFLSLCVLKFMNPILICLTEFSAIKGPRSTKIYLEGLVSPNFVIEYNVAALGYVSSFFGNMNIMMFIWFGVMIATGALFLMSKKDIAMQFAFQLCKRSLMLLILFSAMGLIFSLGLISNVYPFEIIVASLASIILLVQLYHFVKNLKGYYYLDKTFDLSNRKVKYIVGAIIMTRLAQALSISLFRNNTFAAACIILGAQTLLAMLMTISRPYKKTFYNILNILGEWTVAGYFTINLLINLQVFSSLDTENLWSLIQVSLKLLIVFLMALCFTFSLIIDFCSKQKTLVRINFEDFQNEKDSAQDPKNFSHKQKQKFNLKIQDVRDCDNSHLYFSEKKTKYLVVKR